MSAICAVYRRDGGTVPGGHPASLLAAMSEYGSEGSCWAPGSQEVPVGLGCIPWRVTPEDDGYRGPVCSADGSIVAVADARIDNRDELASFLGIAPRDMAGMSDTQLVVGAWRRWEHECPRHLVGDFAFALWDGRRGELFCARDALGQRVLFYHESAYGVELATTADALAALPHVDAALDEQKVADFLVLLQRPERSFFQSIHRLPPGHALIANRAGIRIERYWTPRPDRMLHLGSDEEYVEAFREVFDGAVRSQLRCSGTVGMMTSGGLDSASVAATAARELDAQGRTLPTFHAAPRPGFNGSARPGMVTDESGDVEALARMHPGMTLHIRRNDDRSPLEGLRTLFRMTGAPPRNPGNMGWFLGIYEQAAAAGVRALLTGHKGNATISQTGTRSLRDSAVRLEWRRVWRETHALAAATGRGRRDVLRQEVMQPLTPPLITTLLRWRRRAPGRAVWDVNHSPIHPDFARAMNLEERIREANRHHDDLHRLPELDYRLTVLAGGADVFDLYSGFRPWFGIETRDPTADRRVVEFCMAVPGSQYLHDGETRSLVRRAMAGRLPDSLRLRSTYGMQGPDWTEWLPSIRADLHAEFDQLQRSDTAVRCLDLAKMRRLLEGWPTRLTLAHERDYMLLLLRGITMGSFIRWFEERYA